MAEIRTRIYTYTDQSSNKAGVCSIPLSRFTTSGDTNAISEVLSVTVKYRRYHDTSSNVGHTAQLAFSNGSETISSAKVVKRGDGSYHWITATFVNLPSASDFTVSNVTLKTIMDTKTSHVYWMASSTYPITITVTYYSNDYEPFVKDFKIYRADSIGAASDTGTYISFQAKVGVNKLGSSNTGTFRLRYISSGTSTSLVLSQTVNVTSAGASYSVSDAAIDDHTLGTEFSRQYIAEFAYGGETFVTPVELVPKVFTNVHLAGVSTGGVRFGGFSTSTLNKPKFECGYPVYFDGGIYRIGTTLATGDWSLLTPVNGTTPGTYNGSPMGGGSLRRRKIENKRIIAGSVMVKPPTEDEGTLVIADLKENLSYDDWAPSCAVFSINACQGARIARIVVGGRGEDNEGMLCLSWVRDLEDGGLYTSGTIWVQCSIEYWLD